MSEPQAANLLARRTLLLAVAAMGFAQTVLFAILAPLGREIGLVEVQIGAIISSSSLTLFLVSPLWGRASDTWGRRKVLLIGLFGYSVGTVLFASVFQAALLGYLLPLGALVLLIITRVANATVMAAVAPSANAYMADITSITERIKGMGAIGAAGNIGAILGPAIGGLLAMLILGLGMGLAGPGFMAGASLAVSSEEQGAVAGVAGSCPPLGFTIGPLLGTYLYSLDGVLPYWFAFACYFLLFVFTLKFKDKV